MTIMVNRAVLAYRLFTGISRRHLARLVEELAVPWQAGSRVVAMLHEVEPGSGLREPAPATNWSSSTGWWPR